jgi:3-(methylthio)propanoyl-CoA dehydrogenase
MSAYNAPIQDMRFILSHIVDVAGVATLPAFEAASPDLIDAVLEEASKLARDVLAPLNEAGDRAGASLENGVVRTAPGFRDAYWRYVEGGWNAVPFAPEFGGQGLPWSLAMPLQEMWQSANMSFSLCPMLNQGAVELLTHHGSPDQKRLYLPKMISGAWTGTMNLTEPQAGSDVGAVRTRAVPDGDGAWLITGQKIFITYGEHDWTENIIHLVLARTPSAPAGVKGISLFIVPKFLVGADGKLGARNDLRCAGLERKMGIHASPTAVMAYGDNGGAIGYLVGEENRGIEYMFTMMNNARLGVGLQGVAIAERAYQQALAYAKSRIQGRALVGKDPTPVAIIRHPDVRRTLMTMKAQIEAARALVYYTAVALDYAGQHPDKEAAATAALRNDLLTPIAKAWSTDLGVEIASLGVQIHGGMGFIEETGAAQHYRDARIAPIYEGTNGIQANDLVFRKIGRDGGAAAMALLDEARAAAEAIGAWRGVETEAAGIMARQLLNAIERAEITTRWMAEHVRPDPTAAAAGASPYLRLMGIVIGGFLLARGMLAAARAVEEGSDQDAFLNGKIIVARFYAEHILPQTAGLTEPILNGSASVTALPDEGF